jgi:hypothetical protein
MTKWPAVRDGGWLNDLFSGRPSVKYHRKRLQEMFDGLIDTWDYAWSFSCWTESALSITPNVNLISNLGFRDDGTHTKAGGDRSELATEAMVFPIKHPDLMICDEQSDAAVERRYNVLERRSLIRRAASRMKRLASRLAKG